MKNYKFRTEVPGDNVNDTLLYRFEAKMPLRESKVFSLEKLKSALIEHNAMLEISVDALILHNDGSYVILTERTLTRESLEIRVVIDGLDSELGGIINNENDDTVIELENYFNVKEILGESIFEVMSAYNELLDMSFGRAVNFDGNELLDEIITYSLNQKSE